MSEQIKKEDATEVPLAEKENINAVTEAQTQDDNAEETKKEHDVQYEDEENTGKVSVDQPANWRVRSIFPKLKPRPAKKISSASSNWESSFTALMTTSGKREGLVTVN